MVHGRMCVPNSEQGREVEIQLLVDRLFVCYFALASSSCTNKDDGTIFASVEDDGKTKDLAFYLLIFEQALQIFKCCTIRVLKE